MKQILLVLTILILGFGATAQNYKFKKVNVTDSLKLGSTFLLRELKASATLDFASIADEAGDTLQITVTGAAVGDPVVLGIPASAVTGLAATVSAAITAYVAATDKVAIKVANNSTAALDLASGVFKVVVLKY